MHTRGNSSLLNSVVSPVSSSRTRARGTRSSRVPTDVVTRRVFGSVAIPTAVFRTLVATTPQRLVDFFLEHNLDRLQYPLTQPKLDELPVLAYRLLRYGGRLLHGVILLLAFTGVVWFFLTGGYAILISTGIGTDPFFS